MGIVKLICGHMPNPIYIILYYPEEECKWGGHYWLLVRPAPELCEEVEKDKGPTEQQGEREGPKGQRGFRLNKVHLDEHTIKA